MQVIHSATVKGTGLFECGPYMSKFADFSNNSQTTEILANQSITNIDSYSDSGLIDDPANLGSAVAYIVSGLTDTTVPAKN